MHYRRVAALLALALTLAMLLALPVSANSPAPLPYYTVTVRNLPEGTVYVDLLLPLKETDPHYSSLEQGNLP